MKKFPLTAIVLTLNEDKMLVNCLKTLEWCQEIIVIDSGSTDQTVEIAQQYQAKVIVDTTPSFAHKRNLGLKAATLPVVLYIDADERVSSQLAQEIMVNLETKTAPVLQLKRQNIFFGQVMRAGGWQNDVLARVFYKTAITTWQGEVHESPQYLGQAKLLNSPLIHLTHRSIQAGLKKTLVWTQTEAQLLAQKTPQLKIGPTTILRKFSLEFLRRYLFKRGWRDGEIGFMEAWIQAINKALTYLQVWEIKHQTDITDHYQKIEAEIMADWQNQELR